MIRHLWLPEAALYDGHFSMNPNLVDRLYESAFIPELWPDVLASLAQIAAAPAGWMAISNGPLRFHTGSTERMREVLSVLMAKDAITTSDRWRRAHQAKYAGFFIERDIYTDEELENDPLYRDVIYPMGFGHAAATTFQLPTGDDLIILIEREFTRGPVEREALEQLDLLRPHIARAVLMAARLRLENACAAGRMMEALGLPALVLDGRGKVIAANGLIVNLGAFVRWGARDRACLRDGIADRLFAEALSQIRAANNAGVRSFPVREKESNATMIAHVLPVRLSARDIFAKAEAVLILTPATAPAAPPIEVLQSLFDLTPAEGRIARRFASGATIDDVSETSGVSRNTVRAHLRSIMDKTGCGRQSEIVALLSGIPSFPAGGTPD